MFSRRAGFGNRFFYGSRDIFRYGQDGAFDRADHAFIGGIAGSSQRLDQRGGIQRGIVIDRSGKAAPELGKDDA